MNLTTYPNPGHGVFDAVPRQLLKTDVTSLSFTHAFSISTARASNLAFFGHFKSVSSLKNKPIQFIELLVAYS